MTEAICIGGPLDGRKHEVCSGAYLTVVTPRAFAVPTGEVFPQTGIELVQDTWLYRLENFRSRDKSAKIQDVFIYASNELSTHETMLTLVEGYAAGLKRGAGK